MLEACRFQQGLASVRMLEHELLLEDRRTNGGHLVDEPQLDVHFHEWMPILALQFDGQVALAGRPTLKFPGIAGELEFACCLLFPIVSKSIDAIQTKR